MASRRSFEKLPHDVFGAPPFPSYSWCYYDPPTPFLPTPVVGSQQLVAPNTSGLDTGLYGAASGGREHGDGRSVEGGREHGDGTMSAVGRDFGLLERGISRLDSPGE